MTLCLQDNNQLIFVTETQSDLLETGIIQNNFLRFILLHFQNLTLFNASVADGLMNDQLEKRYNAPAMAKGTIL